MAMKQGISYTRNKVDRAELKGVLDTTSMTITYETKEDGVMTVPIKPYLDQFDAQTVTITISTKIDEELILPTEE